MKLFAGVGIPHRFGLHVQEADGDRLGDLPGQAGAAQDRNRLAAGADADPPAEEELGLPRVVERRAAAVAHGESAGVLEEERPLLRKEEVEPVEVDLLIVHLHLREVGVVGEIESQSRRHAVLQVAAEVAQAGGEVPRGAGVRPARRLADDVRRQLQRPPQPLRRHDASHLARLRDPEQIELPRNRRPVRRLVAAADVALEVDAPRLGGTGREPERPERNGELGAPPNLGDRRPHLPDAVPVLVEAAAGAARLASLAGPSHAAAARPLVGELAVVFLSRGRGSEDEAVLPVEEGVEKSTGSCRCP